MRKNGTDQFLRVPTFPQNDRALRGVFLSGMVAVVGPAFIVKIVEQGGEPPEFFVVAELAGIGADTGFDGQGMLAQAIACSEFTEKVPSSVPARHSRLPITEIGTIG